MEKKGRKVFTLLRGFSQLKEKLTSYRCNGLHCKKTNLKYVEIFALLVCKFQSGHLLKTKFRGICSTESGEGFIFKAAVVVDKNGMVVKVSANGEVPSPALLRWWAPCCS